MRSEIEDRIEELFQEAIALPHEQRASFLQQHCTDVELLRRVQLLLQHDDIAGSAFLRGATGRAALAALSSVQSLSNHPTQIGRFRIISILGHGGMGTVYEAEQDKPHRKVALKVIRPGWMSPAMLRRFEYEAEVLARLDHPGIARVFDAGTADSGHGPQPYFAMELVTGTRLDEYVKLSNPPLKRRLELLIEICQAVHHAHTKGVIHRDLKPSNIVITAEGKPKILDFGVARATDSDIQSTTLHTESGQLIGTLPYMAPEQASGKVNELDTSSDVYALGVIAYELLSGKLPYAIADKPLHEAVRVICEDEPSRLSSIDRNLRGDVETIVGKALEKDKTRRYHTAGELAADVKRYLDYEPITARPPGTWYQVGKFARRNKLLVGSMAVVLLTMSSAVIASTFFAIRAQRQKVEAQAERKRADEQAAIAAAVNGFLNDAVLGQANAANQSLSGHAPQRDLTLREAVDRASAQVDALFKNQPMVEAKIHHTLGDTYDGLGESAKAEKHYKRALELAKEHTGVDSLPTLTIEYVLAGMYMNLRRDSEAEALYQHLLQAGKSYPEVRRQDVLFQLGQVYFLKGRLADSERLLLECAEIERKLDGQPNDLTMVVLATLYVQKGDFKQGEQTYLEALEVARKRLGDRHPQVLVTMGNLASLYCRRGEYAKAEALHFEVLEAQREVLGEQHPDTLLSMNNLAALYAEQHRYADAEPLNLKVLEGWRKHGDDGRSYALLAMSNLGQLYVYQGRYPEAEQLFVESLEGFRNLHGEMDPHTLTTMRNLGTLYDRERRYTEAEALLLQATERMRKVLGIHDERTQDAVENLGLVYQHQRRLDEAEEVLREVWESRKTSLVKGSHRTLGTQFDLAGVLFDQKKFAEAEPLMEEAYRRSFDPDVAAEAAARYAGWYGCCLVKLERYSESLKPLHEGWDRAKSATPVQQSELKYSVAGGLAKAYASLGQSDEAAKWRAELAALQAVTQPTTQSNSSTKDSTDPAAR